MKLYSTQRKTKKKRINFALIHWINWFYNKTKLSFHSNHYEIHLKTIKKPMIWKLIGKQFGILTFHKRVSKSNVSYAAILVVNWLDTCHTNITRRIKLPMTFHDFSNCQMHGCQAVKERGNVIASAANSLTVLYILKAILFLLVRFNVYDYWAKYQTMGIL